MISMSLITDQQHRHLSLIFMTIPVMSMNYQPHLSLLKTAHPSHPCLVDHLRCESLLCSSGTERRLRGAEDMPRKFLRLNSRQMLLRMYQLQLQSKTDLACL
jgi:hypothetical protein